MSALRRGVRVDRLAFLPLSPSAWWPLPRHKRILRLIGVRRLMMRWRALLFVLGASIFVSGIVRAVDRGQFENIPDDIRAWFKGVRSPAGVPCCDISDGHRTAYEVRAGAYWVPINGLWWQVPEKAIVRNAGNPLGEAVVWYVSLRGSIEIRCFVPADAA